MHIETLYFQKVLKANIHVNSLDTRACSTLVYENWSNDHSRCWGGPKLKCSESVLRQIVSITFYLNLSYLWDLHSNFIKIIYLMLKLKLQYFGHLMQKFDSLEKTLMPGGIGGRRRRGWQRMMPGWHYQLNGHEFE